MVRGQIVTTKLFVVTHTLLCKSFKEHLKNRGGENVPFGTQESVEVCFEDDGEKFHYEPIIPVVFQLHD
jgi:hypothetical protein